MEEIVTAGQAETRRKKAKVKRGVKISVSYFFLVLLLVFFLFPFFFMFFKSFMGDKESYSLPVRFFPSSFTLTAYKAVLDVTLLQYFKNTLFVIVFNAIAVPLSASLCAYGFTRVKFQGSEFVFAIVLATIMLPSIVIQIPLYYSLRKENPNSETNSRSIISYKATLEKFESGDLFVCTSSSVSVAPDDCYSCYGKIYGFCDSADLDSINSLPEYSTIPDVDPNINSR